MGAQGEGTQKGLKPPSVATGQSIRISAYKQILFLPLRLKSNGDDPSKAIAKQIEQLKSQAGKALWRPVDKPLEANRLRRSVAPGFDRFSYQEFVYFHSFIQDVLFSGGAGHGGAQTTIFERNGPITLIVDLPNGHDRKPIAYTLHIERLWLYLFDIGVAVAMVEISDDIPETFPDVLASGSREAYHRRSRIPDRWTTIRCLDDVLWVQNAIRRVYPPYFGIKDLNSTGQPWDDSREIAEYPVRVRMTVSGEAEKDFKTDPAIFEAMVRLQGKTPFAEHWRELVAPLVVDGAVGQAISAQAGSPIWEQTMDERLPSMTFVMSPDAGQMNDYHWVRLGAMDDPGEYMPYSKAFIGETFTRKAFYDRHWHEAVRYGPGSWGTRYVISGFGFVCCATDNAFPEKLISHHFSRMYAGMGLLLHLQHAALLSLSSDLSRVAEREDRLEDHQQRMDGLHKRFNRFVQRYWFTNVSNQLQAREIYDHWKRELGLDQLYREVNEQMKDATAFLNARLQIRQADSALRLNQMAAVGLPVAVGTALASIGMLFGDKLFGTEPDWWNPAMRVLVLGAIYAGCFWGTRAVYSALFDNEANEDAARNKILIWLERSAWGSIIFGSALALVFGMMIFLSGKTAEPLKAKCPETQCLGEKTLK